MKKFYVTLVALVIAASGFAQEAVFPAMQVKKESQTFIPKAKKTLINQSKGVSGSYSLSYPEILGIILREYGTDPETGDTVLNFEYERKPIYCDSTARVVFYDSGTQTYDTGRVQFYGIGQIFAFGDKFWNDGSRNAGAYRWKVPDMTTATTFSVNSVSMECLYWRGTEVADSVVDTLVINVLSGLTEATLPYGTLTSDNQDWIGFPNIPYDINTLSVGVPAGAQLKVIKHPLTVTDTTLRDGSNLLRTFPVSGMTNLQAKNVVVFYTFKSGNTHTPNAVMGKELSRFAGICYGDPRPEYVGCSVQNGAVVTEFHPELLSEKNTSLCAMNQYYVSDSWKRLMPMGIWAGPLARPAISLHVTCDDCSWTGIKEMAKKNVTVYPNPATDNFTVTLDATGKSNIEMFNLVGQKVYSKTTSDATVTVNVNNFKSGVYMLKINQNGQVYTSKVVVK